MALNSPNKGSGGGGMALRALALGGLGAAARFTGRRTARNARQYGRIARFTGRSSFRIARATVRTGGRGAAAILRNRKWIWRNREDLSAIANFVAQTGATAYDRRQNRRARTASSSTNRPLLSSGR